MLVWGDDLYGPFFHLEKTTALTNMGAINRHNLSKTSQTFCLFVFLLLFLFNFYYIQIQYVVKSTRWPSRLSRSGNTELSLIPLHPCISGGKKILVICFIWISLYFPFQNSETITLVHIAQFLPLPLVTLLRNATGTTKEDSFHHRNIGQAIALCHLSLPHQETHLSKKHKVSVKWVLLPCVTEEIKTHCLNSEPEHFQSNNEQRGWLSAYFLP